MRTAELLAARLDAATDAREARALARGLGQLGSTWAWEALGTARAKTGEEVRARCARALHAAYDRHEGSTRATIRKALSLVTPDEGRKLAR
jgi:hypothetical protein